MNRNGIAGECVQHQHVECLQLAPGGFPLEGKPGVSRDNHHGGPRVLQEMEIRLRAQGEPDHCRIDFVETKLVVRLTVRHESPDSKADHTHAQLAWCRSSSPWIVAEKKPDPRALLVIGGWKIAQARIREFRSVHGVSTDEIDGTQVVKDVLDAKEIPLLKQDVLRGEKCVRIRNHQENTDESKCCRGLPWEIILTQDLDRALSSPVQQGADEQRSEERRVGKECR